MTGGGSPGCRLSNFATIAPSFTVPDGYVADGTDCDDTESGIYPGATEDMPFLWLSSSSSVIIGR